MKFFIITLISFISSTHITMASELSDIIIKQHYSCVSATSTPKLTEQNINLFLLSLDPFSQYLTKKQQINKADSDLHKGIGINLLSTEQPLVAIPYLNSPAYEAGFTSPAWLFDINHQVIKYNKNNLINLDSWDISKDRKIYKLRTFQYFFSEIKNYSIVPGFYKKNTAQLFYYKEQPILQIYQIKRDKTKSEIINLLKKQEKRDNLIIDLRFSTGGSFKEVLAIAKLFLKEDQALGYIKGCQKIQKLKTSENGIFSDIKIIKVLVSPYTASSAEILTLILREKTKATIIGMKTTGKCIIQELFHDKKGGLLKLSTYQYFTEQNFSCQETGLKPDKILPYNNLFDNKLFIEP